MGRTVLVTGRGCSSCSLREARPGPLFLAGPFPPILTLLKAVPGDGTLPNKVILRGSVIILYYKADEGKVRHSYLKLKLRVPRWAET